MVKGRVQEVFACVISKQALDILQQAGIPTTYASLQPHIINRTGTDICPVEKLTASTDDPDEAYELIKEFLK
jgi:iron complex outermembrane receptor protein